MYAAAPGKEGRRCSKTLRAGPYPRGEREPGRRRIVSAILTRTARAVGAGVAIGGALSVVVALALSETEEKPIAWVGSAYHDLWRSPRLPAER